jgi:hypothetical protein
MTPALCRVKHDPDAGTYGDCVRACVATILDLDTDAVPHFYHDNPTGEVGMQRMRDWLAGRGLAPYVSALPPDPLADILDHMGQYNPTVPYMLYGSTSDGGDHVVVCRGGEIVHNPAWYGCRIVGPASVGHWQIVVLVRL